jgi:curved DNA-binding protein CbpA
MNPYDCLGVSIDTDDESIRAAYLAAVKRWPPEHFPERFTAVNEAYQTIKDADSRLRHLLFDKSTHVSSPMEAVRAHFHAQAQRTPPDWETLKSFLRRCAT